MKNILDLPSAGGVGSAEGKGDCTVGDGAKDGSTLDGEGNATLGFGGNATLDGEGNATLDFGGNATLDVEVNATDGSIVGDGCGVGTGVKK